MPDAPKPRPPSLGDRGEYRRTPPRGYPVTPRQDDEDITGRVDLDELQLEAERKKRPTEVAVAHHDHRLDDHSRRLRDHDIGLVRVEGKLDTVGAKLDAHTAVLGSQSAQLGRLLDERSAETVARHTATTERRTATYRTVLAVLVPLATAVIGILAARGC